MKYHIVAEFREAHKGLVNKNSCYNGYVSSKSINDLIDAIVKNGDECEYYGDTKKLHGHLESGLESADGSVFINYNYGIPSPYKRAQTPLMLEILNVAYSGSDPFVSLLVNDKYYSKKVVPKDILTPRSVLYFGDQSLERIILSSGMEPPFVIKPNQEGSSIGIDDSCLCHTFDSAYKKANQLLPAYKQILVEEYIEGYEVTTWIMGNKKEFELVFPLLIECNDTLYFTSKIITMQDKNERSRTYHLPEKYLDSRTVEKIVDYSKRIFCALGLRDYARIDYRIKRDGQVFFIEANALPIFSKSSEIGAICKLKNVTYEEICKSFTRAISKRLVSKAN